jgi:hypothetical protein
VSLDTSGEDLDFALPPLLPFTGEEELKATETRLAGRVTSLHITDQIVRRNNLLWTTTEGQAAVNLPKEHGQTFLDLLNFGVRTEISPQCVDYDIEGTAWLRRVLVPGHIEGFPDYFLTRLSDQEYALEIEATDQSSLLSTSAWPYPERVGTFTHDTAATHIRLNGEQMPGGRIPPWWIANGSVYFQSRPTFQGFLL